jgi:hypothetical protein
LLLNFCKPEKEASSAGVQLASDRVCGGDKRIKLCNKGFILIFMKRNVSCGKAK